MTSTEQFSVQNVTTMPTVDTDRRPRQEPEPAAPSPAEASANTASPRQTVRPVVVGVDGTSASDRALDWAIAEAGRRGVPLRLLHVRQVGAYGGYGMIVDAHGWDDPPWVVDAARARVLAELPDHEVHTQDVLGAPASAALIAASSFADTVVVGARKHGRVGAAFLGSTSLRVASRAACPVVVIRDLPEQATTAPHIVVGIDGSTTSDDALTYAFARAQEQGLPLRIVQSWPEETAASAPGPDVAATAAAEMRAASLNGHRRAVEEHIRTWAQEHPDVAVQVQVCTGDATQALVAESASAVLVVIGSRGRGSFRGMLLGSVSEGVLHHAFCPVAVVRGQSPEPVDVDSSDDATSHGPDD